MVDFTTHLGSDSRGKTMQKGLISDGHTMALFFGHCFYVLPAFSLSAISLKEEGCYTGKTITTIEFKATCYGALRSYNATDVQSLFLNANTLSIEDLLKLVYERMEQRPS